ncbi:MAG: hypothetical protein GF350_04130 [Chitinivibrionales bacterium]|nr:hypothetical protein [Chitinivibrionales bacterium]
MITKSIKRLSTVLVYCVTGIFLVSSPVVSISLDGINVPKDSFVVYLCIGHSNMAGIDIHNSDNQMHPRCWTYRWFDNDEWVPAAEEPGSKSNGLSARGAGGPGMPFLKQLTDQYPGYYFGVISNASFSSTCRGVNTGGNSSGLPAEENRYWKGAQLYEEIIGAALEVRGQVTFGGILCMLGTVEATRASDESVCRAFSDNIKQMVHDMRDDLSEPYLPFIMGDYEKGNYGSYEPSLPWPSIIAGQIDSIPHKLIISTVINSRGIEMYNDHHFTAVGQAEWAKRAVDSISSRNWLPLPLAGNLPPVVRAGPDSGTVMDCTIVLQGSAVDDQQSSISAEWSVVKSPFGGSVVFDNRTDAGSPVRFVNQAGRYVLRLTASDGTHEAYDDCMFEVFPGMPDSVFFQPNTPDGAVSIETENYHFQMVRGGHTWEFVTQQGNSGDGCMQALPDNDLRINDNYAEESPRLDYYIYFLKTGTHYIWTRGIGDYGGASEDDSYHAGLDFLEISSCDRISRFRPDWTWNNISMDTDPAIIEIETPGVHVFNVYMREDGCILDKIIITRDPAYVPEGDGPGQTALKPLNAVPDTSDSLVPPDSGIHVAAGHIELLEPFGGESFAIGDTIAVRWAAGEGVNPVDIKFSPDRGINWVLINAQSIDRHFNKSLWGNFSWVVPRYVITEPPGNDTLYLDNADSCLILVMEYQTDDTRKIDYVDSLFSVSLHGRISNQPYGVYNRQFNTAMHYRNGMLHIDSGEFDGPVQLFGIHGKVIYSTRAGSPAITPAGLPGGTYFVKLRTMVCPVIICR